MRLKDRVAIVTGGGSGIGKAIAVSLANEGAKVVITARQVDRLNKMVEEIRAAGHEARAIQTDISDSEQVKKMVQFAVANYGTVDILVNNAAAIGNINIPISEMSLDEWQKSIATNLTGTMLCSREVLKIMMPRKSGSIINISSVAGLFGLVNESPYAVTKSGILGFTTTMALEAGPYNIRVNCISPGATLTDEFAAVLKHTAEKQGISFEKVAEKMGSYNSLKRMVKPSEIGSCVAFLASEDASAVTGQNLVVSCGFHITDPVDDLVM